MRIACVYLPSFPLQAHVRQAPHLVGAPVAIADSDCKAMGSQLIACSRAAWEEGVRPGMATAAARLIMPSLQVLHAEPSFYEQSLAAAVDSLLGLSEVIDTSRGARSARADFERPGPHRTLYLRVPRRARGAAFGQRVLAQLSRLGFRARVGVADDRFTAYIAAVTVSRKGSVSRIDGDHSRPTLFHQSCTAVPYGGAAAFLAPLPLSYLTIDPDVERVLHTCGVKTIGDFATLPPPSVGPALIDLDFRALARGEGPATVRGVRREQALARPVVERVSLPERAAAGGEDADRAELGVADVASADASAGAEAAAGGDAAAAQATLDGWLTAKLAGLGVALRILCDRVSQRLAGRERCAAELRVRVLGLAGELEVYDLSVPQPSASSGALCEAASALVYSADGIGTSPSDGIGTSPSTRLGPPAWLARATAIELEVAREVAPGAARDLFAASGMSAGVASAASAPAQRSEDAASAALVSTQVGEGASGALHELRLGAHLGTRARRATGRGQRVRRPSRAVQQQLF
ncbi:MAG: hypothetical protein Tsb0020_06380 [Haliangiales bacterium]